jgi:hypothetical protein
MRKLSSGLIGMAALAVTVAQAQEIPNNTTAGWGVDRYAPASFISTTVGGQTALQTTISSADAQSGTFYATQGEQMAVNSGGTLGDWSLSGNLYVTSGMLAGTAGPLSTELWGGTGAPGTQSGFYIFGLLSGSTARNSGGVFSGSPTTGSQLEVWNDNTGAWTYLNDSLLTPGYNSFKITSDGVGTINYYLDGVDVFTQTGMGGPSGDPAINELNAVFLEDYNFYGQGSMPTTGSYSTAWNDLDVTVPDGWLTIAGTLAMCGSLAGLSRLKRFARTA